MSADPGILLDRQLPGGRELTVQPLTLGRARLCIGRANDIGYDDGW